MQGVLNHATDKGAPLPKRDNDHAISQKDSESGPESLRAEKKASEDICYEDLVPDGTRNILQHLLLWLPSCKSTINYQVNAVLREVLLRFRSYYRKYYPTHLRIS